MSVEIGTKAPDFTLHDGDRKTRSLQELKGQKTVLAFFPGAFTGVCTKEMCAFRDSLSRMNELHANVIGICVDAPAAISAFAKANNLQFPILSDYTRSTIKQYDIVHEGFAGLPGYSAAYRSVFVLDKDGVVRYKWVSKDPTVEPNYDEITKALSSMN